MANTRKKVRNIYNIIVITLLLAGVTFLCMRFVHIGNEYTDNAQVFRHITPVNSRVQGYIKEIRFEEYQHVKKGDTLVIIEDAEYRLRLAQAEANLANATSGKSVTSAGIETTQSNIHAQQAGVDEARVQMINAKKNYDRYAELLKKDAVTRQQFDNMKTAYDAAADRYQQALRAQKATGMVAKEQTTRLSQNDANIVVARAAVELAKLNLGYTVIVATTDGIMGRKEIHEGQLIQPGQPLVQITDENDVWVIANYRETQLENIKIGASVNIKVDAINGKNYTGRVEKIASATGSATSLIPQNNATGNFVKVEQRVPLRIKVEGTKEELSALLAGLNVECEVKR